MSLQHEFESQGNFLFRYRSHLPLILLPFGFWVISGMVKSNPELFDTSIFTTLEGLAILSCLLGLIIRIVTVGYTPKNTSGRNTAQGQVADSVNTTGIYSIVRHPLYLGNYFMWLGIAILTGNICFLAVFTLGYWIYYERIMFAEEQFLTKKFGEVYSVWAGKTPAFIPSLNKWNNPDLSFSWKKVLKKEKNGLFAIFLLVFIFNCWTSWLITGGFQTFKSWSMYAMIATGILYFILKLIKSNTKWLDEEGR
jgi:protein-S-isoprenylcysteine O-methyltransferase Ste14